MTRDFTFRALPVWPYPPTSQRRGWSTFKAGWQDTLHKLDYELDRLSAYECVIGAGFRDQDLRLDGLPRSNAQSPQHPGIEISFSTKQHGRLVYHTDVCQRWEHNVRSIALGLEALRAVDRYDITASGQQYAGFRQIEAATGPDQPSLARGRHLLEEHGWDVKSAIKATHPDAGGERIDFESVLLAKDQLA